jgi:tetratricopeptide (TPR) repeat protein
VEHCLQVVPLAEHDALINPDRGEARLAMLEAYFRLGRAYSFDRALDQAEVWFRKMETLAEQWIADEPASVLARDQLATSHRKIADVRKLAGDDIAARAEYTKAVKLGEELLRADPTNLDVKLHLALALDDQAMTLSRLGLLEDAAPLAKDAERYFSDLVKTDPDDVDNRVRLYQTQYHLGCVEMDRLKVTTAAVHLGNALDGLTALDREGKLDGRPRDKSQLLPHFEGERRACLLLATTSALPDAIRRAPVPQVFRLLRIRVGVMRERGRLDELASAAESLCAMNAGEPGHQYELGRSLAFCAGQIDHIERAARPSVDLKTLRAKLTDKAVTCIVQATTSGLGHQSRIAVDGFLSPIRDDWKIRKISESLRTAGSESGGSSSRDGRNATIQTRKP